jgi:flagellar biosynthesis protein FliQ
MKLPDWYSTGAVLAFLALAGPSLAVCLVLGVAGAVFQTATQIRESAIAFVPKAIGLVVILALGGGLMLSVAANYARHVFNAVPAIVHGSANG